MGRLVFVAVLIIFSVIIGSSLSKDFQKAYDTQKQKIALIEY